MKTAVVLVVLLCALARAQKPAARPTYDGMSPLVTIPYAGSPDFEHRTRLLAVRLAFNGGPAHSFVIDTGSVGIVVPAAEIPGFDGRGEPDSVTYSSSGLRLEGVRVVVEVSFPDAQSADGVPAVAHMPVLAVTRRTCTGVGVNAANCRLDGATHMMGVGFGRGPALPEAQQKNAFAMLDAMQKGAMRRGFVLSRKGVQLGLNAATTAGFVWQKLEPRAASAPAGYKGPRDFETAAGSFEVEGRRSPAGTVLIDTGLTNMMLATPGGPQSGDVTAGAKVRIDLLGGQIHYDFLVGDDGEMTPRRVSWVRASHGVFVNTGLRVLARYDYLYDGEAGYVGLRAVKAR